MHRSAVAADGPGTSVPMDRPIIVHCHLRWDFVWQRPQQILSRLARHAPVLFVKEPLFIDGLTRSALDLSVPCANVFRAVPRLPSALRDNQDGAIAEVRSLVQDAIGGSEKLKGLFTNPIQWFYSPITAP